MNVKTPDFKVQSRNSNIPIWVQKIFILTHTKVFIKTVEILPGRSDGYASEI